MLYYALMFVVVGLIAGALNLAGVSTVAIHVFTARTARVV